MKRNIFFIFVVIFVLLAGSNSTTLSVKAYSDMSTYKIKTGNFTDLKAAQTSLSSFKEKTGWYAEIQETGEFQNYYEVLSGGFNGENRVKGILKDFETATGINATYEGTGEEKKYYEVVSGGFQGETRVKDILQDFQNSTGISAEYFGIGEEQKYYEVLSGGFQGETRVKAILQDFKTSTGLNATYVGIGESENYYQILSGAFSGEDRVKQVLKDFEGNTGIDATYEGVGEPEGYYEVVSGTFIGESRVKQVLKDFEESTGIDASYISEENNRYRIKTSPILGTTKVNKALEFFSVNNWFAASKATGKIGYDRFLIKTVPVLGVEQRDKGLSFFVKNNWYAKATLTGKVGYKSFQIKSDPILGLENSNSAKNYFVNHNWYVSIKETGETVYQSYKIKTKPLLDAALIEKAKTYFSEKKWFATTVKSDQSGYSSFRIRTVPLLGLDKVNVARKFFIDHGWYVTYLNTGKKAPTYEIVTGGFSGYDRVQEAKSKIKTLFGWTATEFKTNNGPQLMYTDYGMTLGSMVEKQMAKSPQTDKYRNEPRYVSAAYVDLKNQVITGNNVNVRTGPSTSSSVTQQLNTGDRVMVISKTGDWVEIRLTWQNAKESDVAYYLNPANFSINDKDYFQFLKLSQAAGLNAAEIDSKVLGGKGILSGKGKSFIEAANKYNINEVYLISHSLLETGNGSSALANGVVYNGKIVYNMYGYGAYDSCPLTCGAKAAYENGWFTPEAAIIGGAQFISNDYIYNDTFRQDTLYKMRWNPVATWHQYATDIGWAYKQVSSIYNIYQMIDNYTLYFDVPNYR